MRSSSLAQSQRPNPTSGLSGTPRSTCLLRGLTKYGLQAAKPALQSFVQEARRVAPGPGAYRVTVLRQQSDPAQRVARRRPGRAEGAAAGRWKAPLRGCSAVRIASMAAPAASDAARHHGAAQKRCPPCGEAEAPWRFMRTSSYRRRRGCGSGRRPRRTSFHRTRRSGAPLERFALSSPAHPARSTRPREGSRASGRTPGSAAR